MSDNNKNEKNSPAYIENLWAKYKKIKGYADGSNGEVQAVDENGYATTTPEQAEAKRQAVMKYAADQRDSSWGNDPMDKMNEDIANNPMLIAPSPKDLSEGVKKATGNYKGGKVKGYADGSDGQVRRSEEQRQNDNTLQKLDSKTGKVIQTVSKGQSTTPKYSPSPEASPSPTPASSSDDEYQDDPSKPLMRRLKDYTNAVEKQSNEDIPSYAMGGMADNQQQNLPQVMDIPKKMDNGGQVQPSPSPQPEKTHNEKIVDILHRITDPNQRSIGNYFDNDQADPVSDLVNQALPKYADGSDGEVSADDSAISDDHIASPTEKSEKEAKRIEKVQGEDTPVSASKLESEYTPEEEEAEKSAGDTTQAQLEDASQDTDEPEVAVNGQDIRQLPVDTISHIEALADVPPEERTPASDQIPPEAQSAEEASQSVTPTAAPASQQSSLLQQLKDAQRQKQQILSSQQMAKAGSLIAAGGAGLRGQKVTPIPSSYFDNKDLANLPLQNFEQQLGIDKEDPNSAISKTYQDHILEGLPNATPQQVANIRGSSANNLDKFLPQQTKLIYGQNAIKAKKDLLQTRLDATKELTANKQDFTSKQNDLNRADRDKIAAMAQEGMKQRFDTPTLDRITNEVRNDPLVKPVILKKASVDESLNLLDNAKTVHPALLSDANFAFTQAMNLQPGATTQKRYDASKITDLNQRVKAWTANNLNNPNADMREDDPDLYNLLHGYLSSVSEDYGHLIDSTQGTVLNTKKAAYQALGRPGIVGGINAMQQSLGNAGRGPQPAGTPAPQAGQQQQPPVTVRRKSDGKTKTLAADAAAQYLKDPGYERVQ